jgi:hypothetical protein
VSDERAHSAGFGQRGHELEALVALHLDAGHFVLDENAVQISCEIKAEFAGYNLASPARCAARGPADLSQEKWRTRHDSNVRPAE